MYNDESKANVFVPPSELDIANFMHQLNAKLSIHQATILSLADRITAEQSLTRYFRNQIDALRHQVSALTEQKLARENYIKTIEMELDQLKKVRKQQPNKVNASDCQFLRASPRERNFK